MFVNEAGVTSKADAQNEAAILKQASDICGAYFAEKDLDKLISGVMKAS